MNQKNKSIPKMRTVLTSRVKSSQNLRTPQQEKLLSNKNHFDNLNPSMNPENIEQQILKKLDLTGQSLDLKKTYVRNSNTSPDSPIKRFSFFQNNSLNLRFEPNQIKNISTLEGYEDQKHNKKQKAFNFDRKQQKKDSGKFSRCMSAQTFRSSVSSRSQKSNRIKQSRKQFDQKFNVAFDYLLTTNSQYLKQKLNLCNQKARPNQKIFTVARPTINTTNKDFYKKNQDKHKLHIQPQNQKVSLLLSESNVCGNSTSHEFHKGSPQKRPQKAEWNEGFKLQGPIYEATTYSNAYPNHGQFKKMVPIAVWNEHPLGMSHRQNTTNSRHFKGQFRSRSQLATWNNLNPVANDLFNTKKDTMYSSFYGKKEKQPIQQWPMCEHKLLKTDGMFNTEMRRSMMDFTSHELQAENRCECGRKKH